MCQGGVSGVRVGWGGMWAGWGVGGMGLGGVGGGGGAMGWLGWAYAQSALLGKGTIFPPVPLTLDKMNPIVPNYLLA